MQTVNVFPRMNMLFVAKDGNPFVDSNGDRMESSVFSHSAASTPRSEPERFLTPPPPSTEVRPTLSSNARIPTPEMRLGMVGVVFRFHLH